MKRIILFFVLIVIIILVIGFLNKKAVERISVQKNTDSKITPSGAQNSQDIQVVAQNLNIPWAIAFPSNSSNDILVTERTGDFSEIKDGNKTVIQHFSVKTGNDSEGGLLGMTLDPNFSSNKFIYFYYTYSANSVNTKNLVARYKLENQKLSEEKILIDAIPGSLYHNGGRIKFGPDGFLYITTGDAQEPSHAQDKSSLAGKILRITRDGSSAPGNPFGTPIYSYGHRNSQGLAWDSEGKMWATEHGRSNPTGFDELNIIEAGKNYGWPTIQGSESKPGMVTSIINSGPTTTWAPGGAVFLNGSIIFAGLRGHALYEYKIGEGKLTEHLKDQLGRIRDVEIGPDGWIYITTSNRDGRDNTIQENDDKIIKVNPAAF